MSTVEAVIARVLEIDAARITNATTPADIAEWDSFNALLIIAELEKEFRCLFTLGQIASLKNVGDIKKILDRKNTKKSGHTKT